MANAAPQRGSVAVRKAALALLGSGAALLTATTAHAHEGHGMPGLSHWHATDIWGFAVLGGIVALAIWMKGRK